MMVMMMMIIMMMMTMTMTTTTTMMMTRSVSNSSPVHVFELLFWTGELLDNFRPKDRAKFHGWIFNVYVSAPGHVTSCLQLMLFGCSCELKGIYNV